MKRGKPKVQYLLAKSISMGRGIIEDQPPFCFSCEQMFPDRMWLEEHACPAASYICSCGTEFGFYTDMLEHSKKHEPGHKVLDHQTIIKRRLEKHKEQDEQLKRLKSTERGVLTVPSLTKGFKSEVPFLSASMWQVPVPSPSLTKGSKSAVPFLSTPMLQVPVQSAHISKVPVPVSQRPLLQNPMLPTQGVPSLFAGSGAPTVNLWTIYQPVVLVDTLRTFDKERPYKCGKCELNFMKKSDLTLHHNTHTKDNIFGCLGCGLLLSSKKSVPRYHQCNSPSSSLKTRLITAMPLTNKMPNVADKNRSQYPGGWDKKLTTVTVPKELRLNMPTLSLTKKPHEVTSVTKGHTCRVCCITFESLQLLQRHKCAKAQEFVAKQALFGKQVNRYRRVTSLGSPYPTVQIHGNRNLGVQASGTLKTNHKSDSGVGAPPVTKKKETLLEDDCYIVDSSPAKTAQMFYQLTSSLPVIKI